MTRWRKTAICAAFAALWGAGTSRSGNAESLICADVAADLVSVDGMLADWNGLDKLQTAAARPGASATLRCAHDGTHLLISIDLRDEDVVRRGRANPDLEDHVVVSLSAGSRAMEVRAFPGVGAAAPVRRWRGGRRPQGVRIEDTLQPRGWSVELAIPLPSIPGWGHGTPAFDIDLRYRDASRRGRPAVVTFRGRLELAAGAAAFASFLRATGLARADIRLDRLVEVDGAPGAERVVAGAHAIGVIDDGFRFLTLPVRRGADVVAVQLVDFEGDGRFALLAHYRQHGNGGSREVVAIWNAQGDRSFARSLAFEVKKQLGDRTVENRWSLVPRGKYRRRSARAARASRPGHDILVEVGPVRGWDEDSYGETPARDVTPILLPWQDQQSAVYHFERGTALGGEPKEPERR